MSRFYLQIICVNGGSSVCVCVLRVGEAEPVGRRGGNRLALVIGGWDGRMRVDYNTLLSYMLEIFRKMFFQKQVSSGLCFEGLLLHFQIP